MVIVNCRWVFDRHLAAGAKHQGLVQKNIKQEIQTQGDRSRPRHGRRNNISVLVCEEGGRCLLLSI